MKKIENEIDALVLLRKVPLLSVLDDTDLKPIAEKIVIRKYKKNEVFIHQDIENQYMYMVISGTLKVNITNSDGKDVTLAIRTTGEHFGELSLIDDITTVATVRALEDSAVAILFKNDFLTLINSHPKFLYCVMTELCSKVREANDLIERLTYNKAHQRVTLLFLKLVSKFDIHAADGITLDIQLTHQDIADMTGLLRETVTHVIDKWRNEGLISYVGKKYYHLTQNFFEKDFIL
ncbi:Crp/Fnr family transcriptional regulator [Candidatus Magnetomonas plexicatena]|uniref:Crp/Fnr family transcriptional regulator n=1 Tax=Candidatus Magnetomonas plexicatena TaxID=2552947 RepID=UPI001102B2C3|nr:Crp/Fnr family transcriptional regulator [Nitrospirales bacterium LBB_01]